MIENKNVLVLLWAQQASSIARQHRLWPKRFCALYFVPFILIRFNGHLDYTIFVWVDLSYHVSPATRIFIPRAFLLNLSSGKVHLFYTYALFGRNFLFMIFNQCSKVNASTLILVYLACVKNHDIT